MAMDGTESKAFCRLRPRVTAAPASRFVLVPSSSSSSSSPLNTSTEGGKANATEDAFSLQEGDNIVEMAERDIDGVGLASSEGGVYDKQVLLRTVNSSTMVMLKAYCDVRVRGKNQPSASPSPRKRQASPARTKTMRSLSPAGAGPRATSPSKILRTSPSKMLRASPGKMPRASPGKMLRPSPKRGMSGGAARIKPGAQQFLLVGDTLELGVTGAKGASCRFSYTLQLASSARAMTNTNSDGGTPGVTAPEADTRTTSSCSSLPAPSPSSSSICRGRGADTDTKRRLNDVFNDTSVGGGAVVQPAVSAGVGASDGGDDDGVEVIPTPIEIIEIDDDDDDGDDDDADKGAVPATTAPKRRRRDDGGAARSKPVGVVNLCGLDNGPVGTCGDQPLDLCDSDCEGSTGEPLGFGTQAAEAAAAAVKPSGSVGDPSPSSCSLGSRGRGGSSSTNRPPRPIQVVPASRKNFVPLGELSSSPGRPTAALAVVKADVPWRSATALTAIGYKRAKVEKPSAASSTSAAAEVGAAVPLSQKPPYEQWGTPPLMVSKKEKQEERQQQQLGRGEDKRASSLFFHPRKSDNTEPPKVDVLSPRSDAKPSLLDLGGDSAAAGMPMIASATRKWGRRIPTTTRALTRMDDLFRCTMRRTIKDYPETSVAVVKEMLGRGTAPDGSLCVTIVSSLLESRCSVRTECLRRQLHAALDVDPDSWTPPEDTAPVWLDNLHSVITGKKHDRPPSDAVLTAHVIVLEVVVDYVIAGRMPCNNGGSNAAAAAAPVFLSPPRDRLTAARRVMQFFECPRRKGGGATDPTPSERARHAVETSAAWAVGAFGSGEGMGGSASSPQEKQRRQRRESPPALIRARLLTARLLAEVAETCGMPARAACLAILAQINSFAGRALDGAGERREPCGRGLGAAARGGLVRALLGRPFCAELARVLLDDLRGDGDAVVEENVAEIGRLEALLSRVVGRRERRGAGADVVLF